VIVGEGVGLLDLSIGPRDGLSDDQKLEHRRLAGLAIELGAFVQFAFTAAPILASLGSEARWREVTQSGLIAELTAARQALEFGVGVALFRTAEIRKKTKRRELALGLGGLGEGAVAASRQQAPRSRRSRSQ